MTRPRLPRRPDSWACVDVFGDVVQVCGLTAFGDVLVAYTMRGMNRRVLGWRRINQLTGTALELALALLNEQSTK